ncbi:unnamed protein product [Caenorhabditis nigoni]
MSFDADRRAKLPNHRRPTKAEVAVKNRIFPEPNLFWEEFVLRHGEMEPLKDWFMRNKRYTMPKRSKNAQGKMEGPANCGVCSSNWGGHPVAPHSIDDCPVPKSYRLRFLATNTPSFCPMCWARDDYHYECRKPGEFCHACNDKKKLPNRRHVPASMLCEIELGDEQKIVDEIREDQYKATAFDSNEKEGPFKVQLPNDAPKGKYTVKRTLYGCPALNIPKEKFGKIKYTEDSYYPGLVSVYQTVEREAADQRIREELGKEYDRRVVEYEKEMKNQSDSSGWDSPKRAHPGNLEANQLGAQQPETHVRVEGNGRQAPRSGRAAWYKKIDDAKSLFQATKEVLQGYNDAGENIKGVAIKPEPGELEAKKEDHVVNLDSLAEVVQEWINNGAKLVEEREINEMIFIMQSELTGQSETFQSLETKNRFGEGNAQRVAYLEVLVNLALIAILGKKKPSFRFPSEKDKCFSLAVTSTSIIVPTSSIFAAIKDNVRVFVWLKWTIEVAKMMELEEEEGSSM